MNFFQRVWKIAESIPSGRVMTYGDIARALGTKDSRRVGQALHANKDKGVPCHRVVFSNGSLASGYAFGGPGKQMEKLKQEGISFIENRVNLSMHRIKHTNHLNS